MPECYEVGKVHSCEFCGTEEQTIGSRAALADAQSLAEQDAHRPLEWHRVLETEPWPLRADPEDGHFEYVIHRRADA